MLDLFLIFEVYYILNILFGNWWGSNSTLGFLLFREQSEHDYVYAYSTDLLYTELK